MSTTPPPASGKAVTPLRPDDPRQLGSYRIRGRLGEGGMGAVFLASSPDGQWVAIKVIRPDFAQNLEFRARFRREAESARRVRRFATAAVLDADPDGPQPYLVTEYVEGPTLSEMVRKRGPLRPADLEHLALSVATALSAIHTAGIIHRDLSPSNVLLSPVGPKVIDFGLARTSDVLIEITQALGQSFGTPGYMAPEQIIGEPVTSAVDVFAWGGVVVFAGTGRPAFGAGSAETLLYRVVHEEVRLDGLGAELRELVGRAMNKNPAQRPTADELRALLMGGADAGQVPGASSSQPVSRPGRRVGRASRWITSRSAGESARTSRGTDALPPPPAPTRDAVSSASGTGPVPGWREDTGAVGLASSNPPVESQPRSPGPGLPSAPPTPHASLSPPPPTPAVPLSPVPLSPPPTPAVPLSPPPTPAVPLSPVPASPLPVAPVPASPAYSPPGARGHLRRGPGPVVIGAAVAVAVAAVVALVALVVRPGGGSAGTGRTDDPAAVSRRLAADAQASRVSDPTLAARLALAAFRVEPTPEARQALIAMFFGRSAVSPPDRGAPIVDVALDGGGRTLAEVDGSGRVRVWKVGDDRRATLAATLEAEDVGHAISAALATDGRLLALGSSDNSIRLWDIGDRAPRQVGRLDGHVSPVQRVRLYTPRGLLVTTSEDGVLALWDVSDPVRGRSLASVAGQTGPVTDVALSPDGGLVATAGVNETVRLWNVSDPRQPKRLGLITGHVGAVGAVAFSPDGRLVATGGDDHSLRLWDPTNSQEAARVSAHPDLVTSVAFAGDRLLLTGGADETVALWDLTRTVGTAGGSVVPPAEIARVGGGAAVDRIAVGGDGRTVAVGDVDGGLRVLSTDSAALVETACADSRNRISQETWEQRVPELPYADPCPG